MAIQQDFFQAPILNSPYEYPARHWQLDNTGQPTNTIESFRRRADFVTPVPAPKKKNQQEQGDIVFDEAKDISDDKQRYERTARTINTLRQRVDKWRAEPDSKKWKVTPETERLLKHWRNFEFTDMRPFFCQIEAAEIAIWLTEVAPQNPTDKRTFLDYLDEANEAANPGLPRLALKLATGAGKTTVMAMLIAWQTVNSIRRPNSNKFTKGFLIVTPGITIRNRLQVLMPNDVNNYYSTRELVPYDMLADLQKAKIVITNYHAFKQRQRIDISKGTRSALEGWRGDSMQTLETEGQMLQRVCSELMGMKNVVVLNDEAHHCYRKKPGESDEGKLTGDDKADADNNDQAARLWISGLDILQRHLGIKRIFDLSATPFFLRGSGYSEGTLFTWTMSDFSLMDAIECGIVKLPRVPVADNNIASEDEMPMYRELWKHISQNMPKGNRKSTKNLDPNELPQPLLTAIEVLYGHYEKTHQLWQKNGINVPPCFIFVCNNTATSKLVYDYISGYERENEDETKELVSGRCELFQNHDEHGEFLARPRTLLIDSQQLESGDALDSSFKKIAASEIEQYRRDLVERSGDQRAGDNLNDSDILREVMNTVGKEGKLGANVRCVVSVSMLTEGWDANTVTHILGVRAFGTQLLCEQVIGRALRRQNYKNFDENNLLRPEYADVLGIPFDFTAKPVPAPVTPPPPMTRIEAVSPQRDNLEITFPRVEGYRAQLPDERLEAQFTSDSTYEITPAVIGASQTETSGIIGESAELTLEHTENIRRSTILMRLTYYLMQKEFKDSNGAIKMNLYGDLKRITRQWLDNHLVCKGNTYPAQVLYRQTAEEACNRIEAAISRPHIDKAGFVRAVLDPYTPTGSTRYVGFNTSKQELYDTSGPPPKCHINYAVLDSSWEAEFCRVAERHEQVKAYVKNHALGFEVPYLYGPETRKYRPDFIVQIDDGNGAEDLLNLIVEIKGYRGEDAKIKKETMETRWVPGVNNLKTFGRWSFVEFTDPYEMQDDFEAEIENKFNEMVEKQTTDINMEVN